MATEKRPSLGRGGDDSQPLGTRTGEVNLDTYPHLLASQRSEIEGFSMELPPRPASPSHSSSSSSSSVDDRTELQKFIQDIDNDEKNSHSLRTILQGMGGDQIYQRSHYAGDKSALHMAVERGMSWAVTQLLNCKPDDKLMLSEADGDRRQPLHLACLNGHKDIADLLLKRGADIEATQFTGATPLNDACWKGHKAVVELLLSKNANTQVVDAYEWSPIRTAAEFNREDIVEILLKKNPANINKSDTNRETPLHAASRSGFAKCVKRLCIAGADCNLQAEGNNTALHYALEPAGDELNAPDEREKRQYDVVVELLKHEADPGIQNAKGETALHLAARSGNFGTYEAIKENMEDGQKRLLDQKEDTALSSALKTHSADILRWMTDERSASKFDSKDEMEALLWAAQHEENHHHAESLFEKRKGIRHTAPPESADSWSAIQWAAYLKMPSVLWLLLATSQPRKIRKAHRLAWDEAERLLKERRSLEGNKSVQREVQAKIEGKGKENEQQRGAERETEKKRDPRTIGKQKTRSSRQQAKDLVLAILQDPPPTVTSGEEEKLKMPEPSAERERLLQNWVSKAAVIKYNEGKDKATLFTQFRSVQEVIYGTGPTKITKEPAETLVRMRELNGSPMFQKICKLQEDRLGDSLFTWVHLPATNITWMNDLLKRILIDDPSCLGDQQSQDSVSSKGDGGPGHNLHGDREEKSNKAPEEESKRAPEVNSFFKASWSQIPDRTSESRIMKPVYTTKPILRETTRTKPQPMTSGSSIDSSDRSLHAIYIPYLTLSIQHRGQDLGKNDQDWGKQQQKKEAKEQKGGKEEEGKDDLRQAYEEYHRLLQFYKDKIHGSATLDESFYHFSRTQQEDNQQQKAQQNDQEQAAQQQERERRNRSQVVAKHIHKECLAEKSHWTIVRVNQLWVWIIGRKWLITATTHPIDQFEDPFLSDVLKHIEERARAEGREVGSRCPLKMAKTIVEYCIDSYDRQPTSKVYGTDDSIRQIFSDSINKIARKDARLFEDFCESIKANQPKEEDKARGGDNGAPKEKEEALNKGGNADRNKRIEEAIKAAANLSAEIRDTRDELQMLQAIAKHQVEVQEKLEKESFVDTTGWIKDMIKTADRIKSNVEMTLSLEQSQAAKDQANESVQQGKILMVFTAITAFFLPSSFLSSLFALDVESFYKVPYWVFLIIFLVSGIFTLPSLYILWLREMVPSALKSPPRDEVRSPKDGEKERSEATGSCESKEENRYTMCARRNPWRKRPKENTSEA